MRTPSNQACVFLSCGEIFRRRGRKLFNRLENSLEGRNRNTSNAAKKKETWQPATLPGARKPTRFGNALRYPKNF